MGVVNAVMTTWARLRAASGRTAQQRKTSHHADLDLLSGRPPRGYDNEWVDNAKRRGVPPDVVADIATRFGVTPQSFDVLNSAVKITDPDGKSFFLLPRGSRGSETKKAVLMTYVLNAGTGYGEGTPHDFPPTSYGGDEVARIINRQNANSWSYDADAAFVNKHGGRLVATPNGMLMGLGGDWLVKRFSLRGGTTWGDIFMVNLDSSADPATMLRAVVESGRTWGIVDGEPRRRSLHLDRVLHHEERHSQQWARLGYWRFICAYLASKPAEWITRVNFFERDAGLSDGGYA